MSRKEGKKNMRTRVDSRFLIATIDGELQIIDRGVLVYEGDTVVFVGPDYTEPCDRTIDASNRIVSPGFISAHTHMGGGPFDRSLREDVYDYWKTGLYEVLMPIRAATDADATRTATRATMLELMKSGVTSAIDLGASFEITAQCAQESGLRTFIGQYIRTWNWATDGIGVTFEAVGDVEEQRLLDEAVSLVRRFNGTHSKIEAILAPAQVDTCSPDLLREIARLSKELNVTVQTHAAQSPSEFDVILKRHGRTPIEYLDDLGLMNERLIIGHGLFLTGHSWLRYPYGDDLGIIAESGATVAHCPTVFERHGQALENLYEYKKRGARVALGLDSAPHSMLAEMRTAGAIGRVLGRSEVAVTGRDLFHEATVATADALGRSDIGRLSVGAKADFVLFRTDTVSMTPLRDPIRNIVHHASPADIDSVYIGGEATIANGRPTYADEAEIAAKLQEAAYGVWKKFPKAHQAGKSVEDISPMSAPSIVAQCRAKDQEILSANEN
ncbi:amidohydrolase family protein (plasmid) [Arthrobacter sp. UC242_113]|uniref:amidohydrolase family protein n=1 Tax=Arthrobacter sp. UC242_113 TaxID=3374550 RepID=UPI0037577801